MIPFNKPSLVGKELYYIAQAVENGHLSGDGDFTKKCQNQMQDKYGARKVLLTHSCTGALEMAAILAGIGPGDEVIMPSYTFVSTANAFALRGARIRFVDIRPDTLNIDEALIETAITERTKAIVPVHYAGVSCEMDAIMKIAEKHKLLVIEDAAQGVNAAYKEKYLGTMGHMGCYSFHETKNIISGEGGALVINDDRFASRAEIIREKGTNRSQFFRGEVDKYTWVDVGSSYLPSELTAAFLYAQLEEADRINNKRLEIWGAYYRGLSALADEGHIRLPVIPPQCAHNAHMFYILLKDLDTRNLLIERMKQQGINPVFHYVPLHSSPQGISLSCGNPELPITDEYSNRLLRLPCFFELSQAQIERVVSQIERFFKPSR